MGTLADKLNYLIETKQSIKQAIIDKGVSVNDNTTFREYATAISNIIGEGDGNLIEKEFTENGTYYASDFDGSGFSKVTVNVKTTDIPSGGPYYVQYVMDPGDGTGPVMLYLDPSVPAGGNSTYLGPTPTKGNSGEYRFIGWNPNPINIQANTLCWAQFTTDSISSDEIQDSWEEICANRGGGTNEDGSEKYPIGSWKLLTIGNHGDLNFKSVRMQKVYSGEAGTVSTWLSMESLPYYIYATHDAENTVFFKKASGYWDCDDGTSTDFMFLLNEVSVAGESDLIAQGSLLYSLPLGDSFIRYLPECLQNSIQSVVKYTHRYNAEGSYWETNHETYNKIWVPSLREMIGNKINEWDNWSYEFETKGPIYQDNITDFRTYSTMAYGGEKSDGRGCVGLRTSGQGNCLINGDSSYGTGIGRVALNINLDDGSINEPKLYESHQSSGSCTPFGFCL